MHAEIISNNLHQITLHRRSRANNSRAILERIYLLSRMRKMDDPMIIKKRREETRGDRDNVIETRPFDGKPPFIDFNLSSVSTKFAQLLWINFSFLVVSHHIIYRDYSPFITGLLLQHNVASIRLILVFRIWIIDSCHCPPFTRDLT